MSAIPIYANAVAQSSLRERLRQAPTTDANLQATVYVFGGGGDQRLDRRVRRIVRDVFSATPVAIFRSSESEPFTVDGRIAVLGFYDGLSRHARLVAGRWPASRDSLVEVAVPAQTARELHLRVGDVARARSRLDEDKLVVARVVGIYGVERSSSAYWWGQPRVASGAPGPLVTTRGSFFGLGLQNVRAALADRAGLPAADDRPGDEPGARVGAAGEAPERRPTIRAAVLARNEATGDSRGCRPVAPPGTRGSARAVDPARAARRVRPSGHGSAPDRPAPASDREPAVARRDHGAARDDRAGGGEPDRGAGGRRCPMGSGRGAARPQRRWPARLDRDESRAAGELRRVRAGGRSRRRLRRRAGATRAGDAPPSRGRGRSSAARRPRPARTPRPGCRRAGPPRLLAAAPLPRCPPLQSGRPRHRSRATSSRLPCSSWRERCSRSDSCRSRPSSSSAFCRRPVASSPRSASGSSLAARAATPARFSCSCLLSRSGSSRPPTAEPGTGRRSTRPTTRPARTYAWSRAKRVGRRPRSTLASAYRTLGAEDALPAITDSFELERFGGESGNLLALDARRAGAVVRARSDFASLPPGELLRPLAVDRGALASLPLPGRPTRIALSVRLVSGQERPSPATVPPGYPTRRSVPSLFAYLRDGEGLLYVYRLGELAPDAKQPFRARPLPPATERSSGVAAVPARLRRARARPRCSVPRATLGDARSCARSRSHPARAGSGAASRSARRGAGARPRAGSKLPYERPRVESMSVVDGALHATLNTGSVYAYTSDASPPSTEVLTAARPRLAPADPARPCERKLSRRDAARTWDTSSSSPSPAGRRRCGSSARIGASRRSTLPCRPLSSTCRRTSPPHSRGGVSSCSRLSWWLEHGARHETSPNSYARRRFGASASSRAASVSARCSRTPAALGVIGALALGFVVAAAFAAVGFAASAAAAARSRMLEFAVLRSLGLRTSQLSGWIGLESALVVALSLLGAPRSDSSSRGSCFRTSRSAPRARPRRVPPVRVAVPWPTVLWLELALLGALAADRGVQVCGCPGGSGPRRCSAAGKEPCRRERRDVPRAAGTAPRDARRRRAALPAPPPARAGPPLTMFVLVGVTVLPVRRAAAACSTASPTTACATRVAHAARCDAQLRAAGDWGRLPAPMAPIR